MTWEQPKAEESLLPEGVNHVATGSPEVVYPKHPLDVGPYKSLVAVAADYFLFSISIPYAFGGLTDKVWYDFCRSIKSEVYLTYWQSPVKLFSGFEAIDPNWNFVLFAVPRRYGKYLKDFFLSVVFRDLRTSRSTGFGLQTLKIQDTLLLPQEVRGTPSNLPLVRIESFGINGSDTIVAFSPCYRSVRIPAVVRRHPDNEMIGFNVSLNQGWLVSRKDEKEQATDVPTTVYRKGSLTISDSLPKRLE